MYAWLFNHALESRLARWAWCTLIKVREIKKHVRRGNWRQAWRYVRFLYRLPPGQP